MGKKSKARTLGILLSSGLKEEIREVMATAIDDFRITIDDFMNDNFDRALIDWLGEVLPNYIVDLEFQDGRPIVKICDPNLRGCVTGFIEDAAIYAAADDHHPQDQPLKEIIGIDALIAKLVERRGEAVADLNKCLATRLLYQRKRRSNP